MEESHSGGRNNIRRAFIVFHLTLAAALFYLSAATALKAAGIVGGGAVNWHLFALASAETIAAVLFVIPATTRIGGGMLIAILLFAFGIHAFHGDMPLQLLVYAAGVFFVFAHGNAFRRPAAA